MQHWRLAEGYRRSSCSEDGSGRGDEDEFRSRSKSLDCYTKRRPLGVGDCEATYRIYDSILKEGKQTKVQSQTLSLSDQTYMIAVYLLNYKLLLNSFGNLVRIVKHL